MPQLLSLLGALLLLLFAAAPAQAAPASMRGVVLLDSPAWTPELLEDVSVALEALPAGARVFPGGPLEIQLHPDLTPFGLGDSTHPGFTSGLTRLHLYGYREGDEPRALQRLERLSTAERRRLWRRRAIVSAVIRRWDAQLHWSDRPAWRLLAGWSGDQRLLVYPWAFSRREGMDSAALDLATFAEELLVPAESLSPAAVALDDRVRCRDPSKSRYLDRRLQSLDAAWRPTRDCPAFDAWAGVSRLEGFEVVFASPWGGSSQAFFGHLLLRIRRTGDELAPGGGEVMQLAALVSPLEEPGTTVVRGLTGGFRGVFALSTLAAVRYEALGLEQRSLRAYKLTLTAEERPRLLERIWELERLGYLDYRFFTANCATMLRFLVAPALDEGTPQAPLTPWEMPTQVLDALGLRLGPPEVEEPSAVVAGRASAVLRRLLDEAPLEVREPLGAAWPGLLGLEGAGSAERARAYQALSAPLPAPTEWWRARVLVAALRLERAGFDAASVARIRAERATLLPGWHGPTTDELVASRQRRFEHETTRRIRAESELSEMLALDAVLRSAPRRPFEASEQAIVEAEATARETFDAAAAAVASLPQVELDGALEAEREAKRAFDAETTARSTPEGGHGHGYLGGGVDSSGVARVRVRAAALAEELGDQRLRGFGAHVGLQLLQASVELVADPSRPVSRAGFTLLGVRTLLRNGWGWGAGIDYAFLEQRHEVTVTAEALRVIAADERLTNFLFAFAGVRGGAKVAPSAGGVLYPRAGLSARLQLPGSFGNELRLEAAYSPRLFPTEASLGFRHGVAASASARVRLGVVRGLAVSARAEFEAQWRPGETVTGAGLLGLELD